MLISINPEYVEKIFSGKKRYEFRKVRFRSDVEKMIIYSTAPVQRIVGEAEIVGIIEDEPEKVWKMTADYSGIDKTFFDSYYRGKDKAVVYKLGEIKKYQEPVKLSDFGINFAPQSFINT
ncbi:ASCH domain-containing protein [Microaerobacter geothermalis]|uniref:ASCH domain-containing protein n=1 Tax=Microaerobacter geothermalis TaxID=674972 RepID=UPI001F3919D1|nr:ASCH domain-containing protein [Microaerobacter geothermalis]MCF6094305.1 ASCH domain-containing protein [Microaerobacter geothermalis]